MKRLLLILLFPLSVFAQDLSPAQNRAIVVSLDNICGDTWCEGDYNWNFANLTCNFAAKECRIELTLMEYIADMTTKDKKDYLKRILTLPSVGYDKSGEDYEYVTYTQSCPILGVKKVSDVYNAKEDEYSELVYDKVSDCISTMEDVFVFLQTRK